MKLNIQYDGRAQFTPEIVNNIMKNRGIQDIDHFLHPTEDDLAPIDNMGDIDVAIAMLVDAVSNNKQITILADTDTDGITSGTIMARYIKEAFNYNNFNVLINEGKLHGLKSRNLTDFKDTDLLIIVDSLDENASQYQKLSEEYNMKIIILDHHAIKKDIDYNEYVTLISSQYEDYPNKSLSGAGVVWKFCLCLDIVLGHDCAYDFADLAACGIVADMMDMTSMENRYIVLCGLSNLQNPALKKIVGGFDFNSKSVSFSIAPIINAANRLNKNQTALDIFLSDDDDEISAYIKQLKQNKVTQNDIVDSLMVDILKQCENQLDNKMIKVVINTEYGISGLIGNRLLSKYNRPIIVLKEEENYYRGSMRAVGVDDFRQICNDSGLAQCDGHELASGIFIPKENYKAFCDYIEDYLADVEFKDNKSYDVDVRLNILDVTETLIKQIKEIDKITGENFKPITIYVDGITDYNIGNMSKYKHLTIQPTDTDLMIIKWNFDGSFDDMEDSAMLNEELGVVGTLDCGFMGRKYLKQIIAENIEVID